MSKQGAATAKIERSEAAAVAAALYGLAGVAVRRVPRSMSLTSLSTLSTLDRTGPRRITDLATVEGVTQPSMTTLVNTLEGMGLVERRGDPTDGRVALVTLTRAGSTLVRRRRMAGVEQFARMIERLPGDEAATLTAAITALEHLRELGEARPPNGGDHP